MGLFRRRPKGTPTGGQFAATEHAEATVALTAADNRPLEREYEEWAAFDPPEARAAFHARMRARRADGQRIPIGRQTEFETAHSPAILSTSGSTVHAEVPDGTPENQIWTAWGGEDNYVGLVPGHHPAYPNSMGYVITERPWTDSDQRVTYIDYGYDAH